MVCPLIEEAVQAKLALISAFARQGTTCRASVIQLAAKVDTVKSILIPVSDASAYSNEWSARQITPSLDRSSYHQTLLIN